MEQHLRLFIAIELPPNVRETLHQAQRSFLAESLKVQWVNPDGTHLTLKFLGTTPSNMVESITAAMAQAVRGHQPFILTTSAFGAFPNLRQPRVVWLGIDGALERLRLLQSAVERHISPLGFPTEQRGFNPHLTLGRTMKNVTTTERGVVGDAVRRLHAPRACNWQVSEVSLMRSDPYTDGTRYTCLSRVELE